MDIPKWKYLFPALAIHENLKNVQKKKKKKIYGDSIDGEEGDDPSTLGAIFALVILLLTLALFGLQIYALVKASQCPYNNILWILLILMFPPSSFIFLLSGCPKPPPHVYNSNPYSMNNNNTNNFSPPPQSTSSSSSDSSNEIYSATSSSS